MHKGHDLRTCVTEEMLTEPLQHLEQWQRMANKHPKIAARFHETIFATGLRLGKKYYDEVAAYLDMTGVETEKVDATLLVSLAERHVDNRTVALPRHVNAFRYGAKKYTHPKYPYSADTLVSLLVTLPTRYGAFVDSFIPTSEEDLFVLASWLSKYYVKQEKKQRFMAFFRKHGHLIENPTRFLKLTDTTVNVAVFGALPVDERKTECKESHLVGRDLEGIPMAVYTPITYGPPHRDIWRLQSTEWSVENKADFLNKTSYPAMFKNASWLTESGHACNEWGAGSRPNSINSGLFYGPVLFPYKIVVDFEDRLNKVGVHNLARYCYIVPTKIKFKLSGDSKKYWDDFLFGVDTQSAVELLTKHIAK